MAILTMFYGIINVIVIAVFALLLSGKGHDGQGNQVKANLKDLVPYMSFWMVYNVLGCVLLARAIW